VIFVARRLTLVGDNQRSGATVSDAAMQAPPGDDGRRREAGSSVDDIVRSVRERVASGELPAGTHLTQERLALEYRVSRTPVREALQQLRVKGTVEFVAHRGAYVRGPSARDIRESYRVRAELEGAATELATGLISADQLRRLEDAERRFRDAVAAMTDDADANEAATREWTQANDAFHEVIQEAACNERLREMILILHQGFPRNLTWSVLNGDPRLLNENVAQHREIREAVVRGDATAARRLMFDHVMRAGELLAIRTEYAADR
jgi:DNA-binding GntR family transcriptional regulator